MNKENCALNLVDGIILYYDALSKKHQIALLLVCGKCTEAATLKSNVVHMGENDFYRTVCRNHVLEELLIARRWAGVKESTSIQLSIRVPLSFALLSISAVSMAE